MYKRISVTETVEKIKDESVAIVDIRDPQSFAAGHMPTAKNVNNQNITDFIREADLDAPLIVVCYHGHSSQPAAQYFVNQGFDEVYSMDGGFEVWKLTQEVEV